MIIIYRPGDGPEQRFDARTLKASEAQIVERTVDMRWHAIKQGLQVDDLASMRGVAWVIAKRTDPTLRFGDLDPGVDEMTTKYDEREIADYAASVLKSKAGDAERDAAFAELEAFAADPAAAAAVIKELRAGPKDTEPVTVPTTETEPTTSGPSPSGS